MDPDIKEKSILVSDTYTHFSAESILLQLLKSPHRGNSNGMQQCVF